LTAEHKTTFCRICEPLCGMIATVDDGRLVSLRPDKDHPLSAKLQKDEIRSAIERVAQFADERSRAIRVQFTNGEVRIFSSSVEMGESEESVPSEYQGPDLEIGFNAQYLLDFLRAVPEDQVALHFRDPNSAGELRPANGAEGSKYRYVIMPMRI